MSTKKEWNKQKIQISIHYHANGVVDVMGIPEGVGVTVMDVEASCESFYTAEDNCQ